MGKTVLSIRDFSILYNIINSKIREIENQRITYFLKDRYLAKEEQKIKERLSKDNFYQDLLRIRDKLGELYFEVKTPDIEMEK
jgi:hypothetical protein